MPKVVMSLTFTCLKSPRLQTNTFGVDKDTAFLSLSRENIEDSRGFCQVPWEPHYPLSPFWLCPNTFQLNWRVLIALEKTSLHHTGVSVAG